jgi:calcineurin-like phosphoesterase family protein
MIYFTSDTHFGHKNIIEYCERPFDNVHIMNQTIFDNINKVVDYDDTLYILGDFCFKGQSPAKYVSKINCSNIHLILGNHDKRTDYIDDLDASRIDVGFSSVQDVKEIIYCNQRIFLSHYPHRSWPASHKDSYHLYGHVHSKLNDEDVQSKRKTLDVGVDNNVNYGKIFGEPWSFTEIQQLFNSRENTDD